MKYKRFGVLIILLYAALVFGQSFEAFSLKSGMTPEQVAKAYPTYEFRWAERTGSGSGSAMLVRAEEYDFAANLVFCNNSLVGLTRNIDPDTDFVRYVEQRLNQFGQPQVSVRRNPWTGQGGGEIETIDFTWVHNNVKDTISFSPEGRTGSGELRHVRGASVGFFLLTSSCMAKNKH
ncbi:MAG: hypothetical protein WA738_04290 [Candidatus Angelobacter sp.]